MKSKMALAGISGILCILLSMGCTAEKKAVAYSGTKSVSDYADVLEENPNGVLANRRDQHIRTQIMSFQFVEGNRIYFCTGSEKPLYGQLVQFPYVSYCTYPENFEPVLSLSGKVVFSDDMALKERVFSGSGYASQFIKNHYKSADNPNLKLFYIDVDEIETYGSEGPAIYTTR